MKKDQLDRIEEFVISLENPALEEEQQVMILQSELAIFAGDNKKTCTNHDSTACGGVNGSCTNHGVCGTSKNSKGCINERVIAEPDKPLVEG